MIKKLIVIFVIILAIALRFIGLVPGYPPTHADEGISHSQGIAMILEKTLDPKYGYGLPYNYPIVVPLLNAFFYLIFFIPLSILGFAVTHINELKAIYIAGPEIWAGIFDHNILGLNRVNVVFWGRYVTALFGTGVVILTYLLGRKLFSFWVGILASFLVAINYRHVLNSHFGLPDIYNSFFLLLSMYLLVVLWKNPTVKNYLLSGVGVAVFFSTKFQFFTIPPMLIILLFLSTQRRKLNEMFRFFLKPEVMTMLGAIILTGLLLNAFVIIHFQETLKQVGESSLKYRAGKGTLDFYPLSYLYHIGVGPLLSWVIIGGILWGIVKRSKQILVLLSVIIPFFAYLIYFTGGGFYTRNFISIIPLLLICGSFGIYEVFNYISSFSKVGSLGAIFLIILPITYQSLSNSIIIPYEYSQNWNQKILQNWLGRNLSEDNVVIAHESVALPKVNKIINATSPGDYFLAEMQDLGIDIAVINLDWVNTVFYWWMVQDSATSLRLWNKPNKILINSPISKMMLEVKDYAIFEIFNPWQAPESNFMVIKIPNKYDIGEGNVVYKDSFSNSSSWIAVNDGFGEISNFKWDNNIGFREKGALKIEDSGGRMFSQRFISPKISVNEGHVYKISGMLKNSKIIDYQNRDGYLEADFFSANEKLISTAISSRLFGESQWVKRQITSVAPPGASFMRLIFQAGVFTNGSFWLDDIEVQESLYRSFVTKDHQYIKSKFIPEEHLFLNSHGGM